jgi:YbbR domain-containing protein
MMDFLRRNVLHNLGLKLLSLGIAVLLWLAIAREPMAEVAITVPIEFHNAPENLEISSESIPQVQVRERGPASIVHNLGPAEVHAIIDLRSASTGEHTYDLAPNKIRAPRDVETLQVIPSQFRISFDKRADKRVPVQPRVIGSTAPGFRLGEVTVDPPVVSIAGPEKRVESISSLITDPVDASGVMGSATFTTHVYVSDPLVRLTTPSTVRVTVMTESRSHTADAPHN